jgi:hypothetical protein
MYSVSIHMDHEKLVINDLILCPANMMKNSFQITKQNSVSSKMDYDKLQRNELIMCTAKKTKGSFHVMNQIQCPANWTMESSMFLTKFYGCDTNVHRHYHFSLPAAVVEAVISIPRAAVQNWRMSSSIRTENFTCGDGNSRSERST